MTYISLFGYFVFFEVKECLWNIPGARPRACDHALVCAHDQNVQYLNLGQFQE